jgi:drug/metabolite transporter (DMT)-like permease
MISPRLTILLASILIPSEKLSINRLVGVVVGVLGVTIAVGVESLFVGFMYGLYSCHKVFV